MEMDGGEAQRGGYFRWNLTVRGGYFRWNLTAPAGGPAVAGAAGGWALGLQPSAAPASVGWGSGVPPGPSRFRFRFCFCFCSFFCVVEPCD